MPPARILRGRRICGVLTYLSLALFSASNQPAQAEPSWTTYHRDAQRSGDDPDATQPIEPALAWQTGDLGAPIWSQPLVLGNRVYVATVADEAYALEASTGEIIWEKSLGTPVPATDLPCGDVKPTVGVVGTPVIDPATQTIYMVADTLNGKGEIEHVLKGLALSDGSEVLSQAVDPPGADPKALLQRTALNLDKGNVVFGYGGNDGDCSDYRGAVVLAPEDGGTPRFWQYKPEPPSSSGGAVWATAGPAVDGSGNVYVTTGNPNPPIGQEATVFDHSDSVLKLNLSEDFVLEPAREEAPPPASFEPPTWRQESNSDLDLGSAAPELLPGELVFQAGKSGTGYLIDEHTMASVYSGPTCREHAGFSGSFGGDAFANATLYIPCENGVQALAYSESAKTFTPKWQGPEDAVGPPIVSAGLVWALATGRSSGGGTTLYGLDPATGAARYTETLPSPVIDHFASPSAGGGRLFLATGCSVTAYQVSQLAGAPSGAGATAVPCPAGSEEPEEANGEPEKTTETPREPTVTNLGKAGVIEQPTSANTSGHSHPAHPPMRLTGSRLHASRSGAVRVALRCALPTHCRGSIELSAQFTRTGNGVPKTVRTVSIALVEARFALPKGNTELKLHLGPKALALLRRHHNRLSVLITIKVAGSVSQEALVLT